MKKILLAAVMLFAATIVNAQSHMTFKGIEINGSLQEVAKQLESKGFTKLSVEKDVASFVGTFTGQNVLVGVSTTPVSKTVCRIVVLYPEGGDSWTILSNHYKNLKERLTKKYGEPDEVTEKFDYPYSELDNPLLAFELEKATYRTRFKTENGGVSLAIFYYQTATMVCLMYWDKENEAKMNSELEGEL